MNKSPTARSLAVLNVKVFHEVDEFLAFLGVSVIPTPTPSLASQT
jgi:hypothetical protein